MSYDDASCVDYYPPADAEAWAEVAAKQQAQKTGELALGATGVKVQLEAPTYQRPQRSAEGQEG